MYILLLDILLSFPTREASPKDDAEHPKSLKQLIVETFLLQLQMVHIDPSHQYLHCTQATHKKLAYHHYLEGPRFGVEDCVWI